MAKNKKFINKVSIEGYIYDHDLKVKVAGEKAKNPGAKFIQGWLSVATDEEMLNVVQIHFVYVTPFTSSGKINSTYGILSQIIDEEIHTIMNSDKEHAGKVRIDSALGLNEWYDTRSSSENPELISRKRNEGGFIHLTSEPKFRAEFETDMLITRVTKIEANEEKDSPEKVIVKGYIFNFRGDILPVDFTVFSETGIAYFEGLEPSEKEPVFTKVKGKQISKTVIRKIVEESAFDGPSVREVPSTTKDFVVNWALPTPYAWDEEDTLLASEVAEKMANREIYLATLKQTQDEYNSSKQTTASILNDLELF